jgi:4a-hydroxytetrahydrobiopterin dehydratase
MFVRSVNKTARFMSTGKTILITPSEREQILSKLQKWTPGADETSISRSLKFSSFSEAWGFMSRVALRAEKLNHHPEWKNVWY